MIKKIIKGILIITMCLILSPIVYADDGGNDLYFSSDYIVLNGSEVKIYAREDLGLNPDDIIRLHIPDPAATVNIEPTYEDTYDATYAQLLEGITIVPLSATYELYVLYKLPNVSELRRIKTKILTMEEHNLYTALHSIPETLPNYHQRQLLSMSDYVKNIINSYMHLDLNQYQIHVYNNEYDNENHVMLVQVAIKRANGDNFVNQIVRPLYFNFIETYKFNVNLLPNTINTDLAHTILYNNEVFDDNYLVNTISQSGAYDTQKMSLQFIKREQDGQRNYVYYNNNYNELFRLSYNIYNYTYVLGYEDERYKYNVTLNTDYKIYLPYNIREISATEAYIRNIIINNLGNNNDTVTVSYNTEKSSMPYKVIQETINNKVYTLNGLYDACINSNCTTVPVYLEFVGINDIHINYDKDYIVSDNNDLQLEITYNPDYAYLPGPVEWSSDKPDVLDVNTDGLLTPIKEKSTANITAKITYDTFYYTNGGIAVNYAISDTKRLTVVNQVTADYYEILDEVLSHLPDVLDDYAYMYDCNNGDSTRCNLGYTKFREYIKAEITKRLTPYLSDDMTVDVSVYSGAQYDYFYAEVTIRDSGQNYTRKKLIYFNKVTECSDYNCITVPDIPSNIHYDLYDLINISSNEDCIARAYDYLQRHYGINYNYLISNPVINESDATVSFTLLLGHNGIFYNVRDIVMSYAYVIEVPYEIRDENALRNYLTNNLNESSNQSLTITLTYQSELTENYQFNQEHFGIYNIGYNGKSKNIVINREERKITDFNLANYEETVLANDGSYYLNLAYEPTNAIYEIFTFTSSDETIATVDNEGKVTPLKTGTTTITVCYESNCKDYDLTVTSLKEQLFNAYMQNVPNTIPKYNRRFGESKQTDYIAKYLRLLLDIKDSDEITITVNNYSVLSVVFTASDEYGNYRYSTTYSSQTSWDNKYDYYVTGLNTTLDLKDSLNNDLASYYKSYLKNKYTDYFEENTIVYSNLYTFANTCEISYDRDQCEILVFYVVNNLLNVKSITVYNTKQITIPYNARTNEQIINAGKEIISGLFNTPTSDIQLTFNSNLTNEYTIPEENVGVYNLTNNNRTLPITLYRTTNHITDVSITSDRDYIILEQNNKLQLNYEITPADAIYEELEWYSTNETIATVDHNGLVTALKCGQVKIGLRTNYSTFTSKEKTIKIYTEPEYTLNEALKDYHATKNGYEYFADDIINNPNTLDKIVYAKIKDYLSDPRITYEYTFSDIESTYFNRYTVTFSIPDLDGTLYTINKSLYLKTGMLGYNASYAIDISDKVYVSLINSLKYDINDDLDYLLRETLDSNTIYVIFDKEDLSSQFSKKLSLDILIGYKRYGESAYYYYDAKTIIFSETDSVTVPYEVRTQNELINNLNPRFNYSDRIKITYRYNEELSNLYQFTQDNMGIYDFIYNSDDINTVTPIIINREERHLTDIEVTAPTNKVIFDGDNFTLQLSVNRTPSSAIYENINWSSSDETILTVTSTGEVIPHKLGTAIITACDDSGEVCGSIEIEAIQNNINLIDYKGNLFLYENGLLYYFKNGKLNYLDKDIKELFVNNYYLTNDNVLYYYSNDSTKVAVTGNAKYYNGYSVLKTDGTLYQMNYDELGDEILTNVKDVYSYDNQSHLMLTNNNDLYVVGSNKYGEKFNNNEYINEPILFASNIKEMGASYYLTNTNILYAFSNYAINPTIVDENVGKVLAFNGQFNYSNDSIAYAISKNNKIVYGRVSINNKTFVIDSYEINNIEIFDYYDKYYYTNNYYYIDKNSNLYVTGYGKVAENVKEAFYTTFDYTHNYYLHYITNDNKLYRLVSEKNSYYITNNIESFEFGKVFKTTDNNYWMTFDNYDYPSKIVNATNPTISAKGIYIYENTKKNITVGEYLDILAIILPYNATNKNIIWSVSNPSLAAINNRGVLQAINTGTVTVYARTEDGNYLTSVDINIYPKPNEVTIYKNISLVVPTSSYFVVYANIGPVEAIDREVVWTTNNENIIRIEHSSYCELYDRNTSSYIRFDSCAYIYTNDKVGEVTIYAKTKDRQYSDSITVNVVQNYESITFPEEEITINLRYTNKYLLEPIITPDNFDKQYIKYSFEDSREIYSVDSNGLITINDNIEYNYYVLLFVSAFGRSITELEVYIINEDIGSNYLNGIKINGNLLNNFYPNVTEYTIRNIDAATINLDAIKADNNASVFGTGNKNLSYGKNTFKITVINPQTGEPLIYTLNIYRSEPTPTINIDELDNTANNTTADTIIVNIDNTASNVIDNETMEVLSDKEITLKINKYDRDLLLYSWDIDTTHFESNNDFDSYITITKENDNITNIQMDMVSIDFNYQGTLPTNTKVKVYVGNNLDGDTIYLYENNDGKLSLVNDNIQINNGYVELDIDKANELYLVIPTTKGDLNSNTRIDLSDIITLLKLYLGVIQTNKFNTIVGDIDNNGNINLSDIIGLLKLYLNGN